MRRIAFACMALAVITIGVLNTSADGAAVAGNKEMSSNIVTEARRWIGTNPTSRDRLWCARFMNFVLQRIGYRGTGSDMASSFASYGHRLWGPRVGAIAVMTRGNKGGTRRRRQRLRSQWRSHHHLWESKWAGWRWDLSPRTHLCLCDTVTREMDARVHSAR